MTRRWLLLLILGWLVGCGGAAGGGPYNATSDGDDSVLMLKGHDPVAYFVVGKHLLGRADIKAAHQGATYRFANEENRVRFVQAPEKYLPQYGGYCANGIAYGIPWGGDPDTWRIIDGKLYIFGGQASLNYFQMDEASNRQHAERLWISEVRGSTAVVQRYKRLIFKVSHYQTGAQLEAEWQRRASSTPANSK